MMATHMPSPLIAQVPGGVGAHRGPTYFILGKRSAPLVTVVASSSGTEKLGIRKAFLTPGSWFSFARSPYFTVAETALVSRLNCPVTWMS